MSQHDTPRDAYLSLRRFQTFFRDVVEPGVWSGSVPVRVAVHQLMDAKAEPISAEEATGRAYTEVPLGWRWGPKWSTAWFRVVGEVPAAWRGSAVALRFSSGTEGQIWSVRYGGRPSHAGMTAVRGLDVNRDAYHLTASAAGGEAVKALIEAACNHPFGVVGFEWDHSEVHARWNSEHPGVLSRAELARFEPTAWELRQRYAVALGLLEELPLTSARAGELLAGLRAATNAIDQENVAGSAARAMEVLGRMLTSPAAGSTTRCFAVGHAHLDTAWLWPIRETKRKVLRTFSNQLENLERFPGYVFLASQTQHYAWAAERDPALFERIRRRVEEGRWEAGGGMWIEPDVNCVSGESLIRQVLVGEGWWRERFGDRGGQRYLYLPDTFGFGSNLPQIMRHCGLDTFITNKLHWWQHTTFPHTTFVWRGIDGSWVIGHNTPGRDYNATNTPKELRRGEEHHRQKDAVPTEGTRRGAAWLQPFGFGDGGGGATDWSVRFAELAADCDGLPRVGFSRVDAFCEELHEGHRRGAAYPEWIGELDMEIHRGTLTTQGAVKAGNRRCEESLRIAEIAMASEGERPGDRAGMAMAWRLTLLNQFHDILPGSSIGWVYEDAGRDQTEAEGLAEGIAERGLSRMASRVGGPLVAFNPTSSTFSGVAEGPEGPVWVEGVPALGVASVRGKPSDTAGAREVEGGCEVWNGRIRARIDGKTGRLVSLTGPGGECLEHGAGPEMYEDRPIMWDAWDVDHYYPEKPLGSGVVRSVRVVEGGPLRAAVEVRRTLRGEDEMVERYEVRAGSGRVDVRVRVAWSARHVVLRYEARSRLDLTSRCEHAVHLGHQARPTSRNTAHERARFEFPAQGWVDVSRHGLGLAMLSDCKFGFSAWSEGRTHRVGVSLLRGPTFPDPSADIGEHEMTVSLMPHGGDWRAAGVLEESEGLRSPVRVMRGGGGTLGAWSPIELSGNGRAAVMALKPAERGGGTVLRLHEAWGRHDEVAIRWNVPAASVVATDGLERPLDTARPDQSHAGGVTRVTLRPFEIVTLLAR